MLTKIEEVLLSEKPNHMIVAGDTNSTLAGALVAIRLKNPRHSSRSRSAIRKLEYA